MAQTDLVPDDRRGGGPATLPGAPAPAGTGPVTTRGSRWINHFDPEDPAFWASPHGRPVARRNLVWSVPPACGCL